MTITADGAFAWTPTEAQGGAAYAVTITVTDNGSNPANLTDWETFTITVGEVNVAPVLGEIGNQSVSEGSLLTFTVTASDADLPANTLVLSAAGLPSGATFDPGDGRVRVDAERSPGPG